MVAERISDRGRRDDGARLGRPRRRPTADFDFDLEPAADLPFFKIAGDGGRVRLTTNTPVGLLKGAAAYLGKIGAVQMNWEGTHAAMRSTPSASRWT